MLSNTLKLDSTLDSKSNTQPTDIKMCPCEQIYQAAKNPDKSAARTIIKKLLLSVSIDVEHSKMSDTAISKLAAEGNADAVNFLRREFNASLFWMAEGYAIGGDVVTAKAVLHLVAERDRYPLLKHIARGFARKGNVVEVNKMLDLVKHDSMGFYRALLEVAKGYALGNHSEEAEQIITLETGEVQRRCLSGQVILGYAESGNVNAAKNAFATAPNDIKDFFLSMMIEGYARSGNLEANKPFLLENSKNNNPDEKSSFDLLRGFGQGGHSIEANKFLIGKSEIERDYYFESLAVRYSESGHTAEAIKAYSQINKKASVNTNALSLGMITFFSYLGNFNGANKVLALEANAEHKSKLLNNFSEYLKLTYVLTENSALHMLSSFNPVFQKDIAAEIKKDKQVTINLERLVPKASKLTTIISTKNLSFYQAIGWTVPELHIWFLQGPQLIKNGKLSAIMFLIISTYLSPNNLKDSLELANKLTLTSCRDRFFNSLNHQNKVALISSRETFLNSLRKNNTLMSYQILLDSTEKNLNCKKTAAPIKPFL